MARRARKRRPLVFTVGVHERGMVRDRLDAKIVELCGLASAAVKAAEDGRETLTDQLHAHLTVSGVMGFAFEDEPIELHGEAVELLGIFLIDAVQDDSVTDDAQKDFWVDLALQVQEQIEASGTTFAELLSGGAGGKA